MRSKPTPILSSAAQPICDRLESRTLLTATLWTINGDIDGASTDDTIVIQLDPKNAAAREEFWKVHIELDADQLARDPELLALVDFRLCIERAGSLPMMIAHITEPAPEIEACVPGHLPPELATLLKFCLAKQPGDRPHDARARTL